MIGTSALGLVLKNRGSERVIMEKAEGMALGVKHHPDVVLWLMVGQYSTLRHGPTDPGVEVSDADVEVDHHELLAFDARPHRRAVVRFPLNFDLHVARRRTEQRPAICWRSARLRTFAANNRPAKETFVEFGERDRVSGVQSRT